MNRSRVAPPLQEVIVLQTAWLMFNLPNFSGSALWLVFIPKARFIFKLS